MSDPRKPAPKGWPRISSSLYYDDPRAAIDWLCKAFGFQVQLLVDDGEGGVAHSQLVYGDGLVMVAGRGDAQGRGWARTPGDLGGNTQNMMVFVDDVDAHCAHARQNGATVDKELSTQDYGEGYWVDRSYGAVDVGGHHWWFTQRLSDTSTGPK